MSDSPRKRRRGWRYRLALRLHTLAGRLHPDLDFRQASSLTLTLERKGWTLHFDDRAAGGLPVWYRHPEYTLAHDDAREPV